LANFQLAVKFALNAKKKIENRKIIYCDEKERIFSCHLVQALAAYATRLCSILGAAPTTTKTDKENIASESDGLATMLPAVLDPEFLSGLKVASSAEKWNLLVECFTEASMNLSFEVHQGDSSRISSIRSAAFKAISLLSWNHAAKIVKLVLYPLPII
jgi:hypothetical protein